MEQSPEHSRLHVIDQHTSDRCWCSLVRRTRP
jgi:hypothetical protein